MLVLKLKSSVLGFKTLVLDLRFPNIVLDLLRNIPMMVAKHYYGVLWAINKNKTLHRIQDFLINPHVYFETPNTEPLNLRVGF